MCSIIFILVFSQSEIIGFPFLKIEVGARPVGMGGAFTAVSDDPYAVFWNPGGMGNIRRNGVSFHTMNVFWIGNYTSGTAVFKIGKRMSIGILGGVLSAQDIERTETGEEIGTFNYYDTYLGVSGGYLIFKNLSFGTTAKFAYTKIHDYSAGAMLMDIGILYVLNKYVTLGTALQNLGTPRIFYKEFEFPPITIRNGIAFNFYFEKNHLILSADLTTNNRGEIGVSTGFELRIHTKYEVMEKFINPNDISGIFIRGGYRTGTGEGVGAGFSLGIGVEYEILKDWSFVIDAVSLSHGFLGMTQRASFSILYEPTKERKKRSRIGRRRSK